MSPGPGMVAANALLQQGEVVLPTLGSAWRERDSTYFAKYRVLEFTYKEVSGKQLVMAGLLSVIQPY